MLKNVYLSRTRSFFQSTRVKAPEHHFPFQVGGKQIFIKPCQVKIILPPVNSVHRVSVCADSLKKKKGETLYDIPFRLFVSYLLPILPIMSRAPTASRIEVHLGTKWAPKMSTSWCDLTAMLQNAPWCSAQPLDGLRGYLESPFFLLLS